MAVHEPRIFVTARSTLPGHLPTTTRAAILVELGKPLVLGTLDLPAELLVGQVLVRVMFSGICGSQLGEIDGVKGADPYLPHLLGHEATAEVLAIGPGVSRVAPGMRVILHWRPASGIEALPPRYLWNSQIVNAGRVTTFNEFAVISENRMTALPDGAGMRESALYGCAITTGFGAVENSARVRMGDRVVVFGAGGIGLNIIQACRFSGAAQIVAIDRHEPRLSLASACGATETLATGDDDTVWRRLREIFGSESPDVFFDNTGNPEVIECGYSLVGSAGRVVLVGVPKSGNRASLFTLPLHFGKSIRGTHGGDGKPDEDIPRYARLIGTSGTTLHTLISDEGALDDVNDLIQKMRSGHSVGRCVIRMTSP